MVEVLRSHCISSVSRRPAIVVVVAAAYMLVLAPIAVLVPIFTAVPLSVEGHF